MSDQLKRARIIRSSMRVFDCMLDHDSSVVSATALGNLLKGKDSLVVGDYVFIEEKNNDEYFIVERESRKNEVYRLLIRENRKKVTAANLDYLIILSSVSKPQFKRGFVDRFLVRAYQWGIEPIVVFNKMDQYDPEDFDIKVEADRLSGLGIDCFETSAVNDSYEKKYLDKDMSDLQNKLADSTSLFVGQSGVGKSKIITAMSGQGVELKSAEVGKVGKGTHTTTWSELLPLEKFSVIDSPGIRSFSLDDIDPEDLQVYFPDLDELMVQCRFSNCAHEENSKGCYFFEQLPESRERELILSRLDSYQRFVEEISQIPFWKKGNK